MSRQQFLKSAGSASRRKAFAIRESPKRLIDVRDTLSLAHEPMAMLSKDS